MPLFAPTPDSSMSSIGATSSFKSGKSIGGTTPLEGPLVDKTKEPRFYHVESSMITLQSILECTAEACADDFVFGDEDKDFANENRSNEDSFLWCEGPDKSDKNAADVMSSLFEDDDLLMSTPVFPEIIGSHTFNYLQSAAPMPAIQPRICTTEESFEFDNNALEHLSLMLSQGTKDVNEQSFLLKRKRTESSPAIQDAGTLSSLSSKKETAKADDVSQQPLFDIDPCPSFDCDKTYDVGQEQD